MRFKSQLSKTPGVILEKSEVRILHAAKSLCAAVQGVLGEEKGAEFIEEVIDDYQMELDHESAKAGANGGGKHG